MMKARLTFCLVAVTACVTLGAMSVTPAFAVKAPKATGGVAWTAAMGFSAAGDFVAMDAGPPRGTMAVSNHDNVTFSGDVTCFNDLGDGVAYFGGTITDSSFVDSEMGNVNGQSLDHFFVVVDDNGEPGNLAASSNPDKITVYRPASSPTCALGSQPADLLTANQQLTSGNLVMHAAS